MLVKQNTTKELLRLVLKKDKENILNTKKFEI